jgi:hypothetical protein
MKPIVVLSGKSITCLYLTGFILLFLIAIGLNSCCTEKYCLGADNLDEVILENFASSDMDSIFVVSYKKGSDFRTVVDSFMVTQCDSLTNTRYVMALGGKRMNAGSDYQIYFSSINKYYKIMGFRTSKSECNSCSPSFIKDNYTRLDGYEINGKFKSLGFIEIDKNAD